MNKKDRELSDIGHKKRKAALLFPSIVLAAVSLAVYLNTLSNGFVYDDKAQVVENQWIRGAKYIPNIFTESVWGFVSAEEKGLSNYYRPLMHLTYMAEYALFGLKPWGFHLVNILFHSANSILVFLLIARLLGGSEGNGYLSENSRFTVDDSRFPALIGALLFATHPIHTEAVTWVASLPEVAFTFFCLLSLLFYIRYREGRRRAYLISLVSFAASLLFKEPALTLPLILIAYDFAFPVSVQPPGNRMRRYIPYVAVAGIYLLLRVNALKGMAPSETYTLTGYQYIINIFPLFARYLKDLLFPFPLNFWHSFHPIDSLLSAGGEVSLLVTLAFGFALIASWKRSRIVFFSLLFIAIPLLPAFYIKGIGGKPYAERYLYLPSAGFFVLVALLTGRLLQRFRRFRIAILAFVALTTALYSAVTIGRNFAYKDDFTLFEDTLKKSPDAVPIFNTYGMALTDAGNYDKAIAQYKAALKVEPDSFKTHVNIAVAYGRKGEGEKALEHLFIAQKQNPYDPSVYNNLGNAYAMTGAVDKAIEEWRRATELMPDFDDPHFNLAKTYEQQGLADEAVREYETVVRLRPDNVEAHYNLARIFMRSGRLEEAAEQLKAAVELSPRNASYHNTLGALYARQKLFDEAVRQFEEALRLAPDKTSYRQNLERAIAERQAAGRP